MKKSLRKSWTIHSVKGTNFLSFKHASWNFLQTTFVITGHKGEQESGGYLSNGSGKTSFIEMLHMAIFGRGMSGRRMSQCIRYGESAMELSIVLRHSDGAELAIQRSLKGAGASKLKVLHNNKPIDVQSVSDMPLGYVNPTEGNKWILNKIDISIEDVSSFYFVSPLDYKPLFNKSENSRIKLFKRLSKVLPLDNVIEDIKTNISSLEEEQQKKNSELIAVRKSIEQINTMIKDAQEEHKERCRNHILVAQGKYHKEAALMAKITAEQKEQVKTISSLDTQKNKLTDYQKDVKKSLPLAIQKEKDALKKVHSAKGELKIMDQNLKAASSQQSSVTCPGCSLEFSPFSQDDITEMEVKIVEQSRFIKELETVTKELSQVIEDRKADLQQAQTDENALSQKIIDRQKRLEVLNTQYNHAEENAKEYLQVARQNEKHITEGFQSTLLEKKTTDEKEAAILKKALVKVEKTLTTHNQSLKYAAAFSTTCCFEVIKLFCSLTNEYLLNIHSGFQLHYTGTKTLASGDTRICTLPLIYKGGVEVLYSALSFGERARLNVCMELVMQRFINNSSASGGLDVYVNDEVISGLDEAGVKQLYILFEKIDKLILFVTHSSGNLDVDRKIHVRMHNGVSVIER